MRKAYKHRIYPGNAQQTLLERWLALCCELYNAALQERRDAYRQTRKSVTYKEQANQLPEIKASRQDCREIHSQVLQDVLKRLDKAFDAFFRRVTSGDKAGFPRLRSRSRYDSFTFPQSGFALESGGRLKPALKLSKIGKVKIKLHRPIEGKIKTCTITRTATGKWFACLSVEVEAATLPKSPEAVGVDVGIKTFAHLSTGEAIENAKFLRQEETELARAQRKLSVTAKGSPGGVVT